MVNSLNAFLILFNLNPASVEFAEDARRQGRRRTYDTSSPCQHRRFGKIGAPEAVSYFQKSQPLWPHQIDAYYTSITFI